MLKSHFIFAPLIITEFVLLDEKKMFLEKILLLSFSYISYLYLLLYALAISIIKQVFFVTCFGTLVKFYV